MPSGVYKIQSISHPERCYIGSAVNFGSRWSKHRKDLEKNKHHSSKLQHHYNKYGSDDFVYSILIECEKERAVIKEQCFINIYKPWFNVSPTAGSTLGLKMSEQSRKNIGASVLGRRYTDGHEHNKKISETQTGENNSFFGKHHSDESKRKKSEWNITHGIKPPCYHGGRKKGTKNKPKVKTCQV